MDRKNFHTLINDNLPRIVKDELDYLNQYINNRAYTNLYIIKDGQFIIDEKRVKELYYLYEKHKVSCKNHMRSYDVYLDRHKLSAVFLFMVMQHCPIKIPNAGTNVSSRVIKANMRVAFRFACAYACTSLFSSFLEKATNKELSEEERTLNKNASELLMQQGGLCFPKTREELEDYVDNYINVLCVNFKDIDEDANIPYTLVSDTFYWLDVYTKKQLKIDIKPMEYKHGLNRFAPSGNNQSQETNELTITEDNDKGKSKK